MKLTKEQALAQIKELQNFIEELDNPKITNFSHKDVFALVIRDSEHKVAVLENYNGSFSLRGYNDDLTASFSNQQNVSREEMISYLNHRGYKKIGTLNVTVKRDK